MKKIKSILFLTGICLLASCTQPVNPDSITAIEIAGPYTVLLGKTITLIADVIGTDDEDVIWSSENEEIATVDQNGIVTGKSEGVVNIIATSIVNPNVSSSYEVNVTLPKADKIILSVEDNDLIVKKNNDTYDVPLGLIFTVDISVDPVNTKQPENLVLEVQYPSDSTVNQSTAFVPEIVNEKQIKIKTLESENNIVLIVKAIYEDLGTQALVSSLTFNVIDNNLENVTEVQSLINDFKTVEETSLIKSTISKTKVVKESDNYTKTVTSTNVDYYQDAAYADTSIKTYKDEGTSYTETNTNYFNGVFEDTHYAFAYDNDNIITKLYKNEANRGANDAVYFEERYNGTVYGFNGLLNDLLTGSNFTDVDVVTISNTYCYPYAEFTLTDAQYLITSNYYNEDTATQYDVKFIITRDNKNVISGYSYEVTAVAEGYEVNYVESVNFVEFGTKKVDSNTANVNHLDISDYYFESFDLIEYAGKKGENGEYDYTNLKKYGSDDVKVVDNITTYYLTYDKVLVLGIANRAPSSASTLIDYIKGESSNVEQIPNVSMTGDGIFTISPKKNDDGNSLPGEAIFTFTSKGGFETKIKVVFKKTILKGLLFDSPTYTTQDMGEIFVGSKTDYFFLNSDPDEDIYKFGIDIVSGEEDGLELYKYENGNLEGVPGFAYAVSAKKVGTYTFKFYIQDHDYAHTEEFTLKVKDAYSVDYLKEQLVKPNLTFRYFTGTMEILLQFVTETKLQLTQTIIGEDSVTEELNYHFEKGKIIIEDNQAFGEAFYYTNVKGDSVSFNDSLTVISMYLSADSDAEPVKTYSKVSFKKVINHENFGEVINDSYYEIETFISGIGMTKLKLTFNNGKGSLVAIVNETGAVGFSITFNYEYDSASALIRLSGIAGNTSEIYISRNYIEVDIYNSRLVVFMYTVYSEGKTYFAF